ncbi:MAG: hypothetical protein HYU58_08960 [Proteobacteria bacterium]|nr:hypothetical protein [Pseudomonadota bacterium]
MTDEQKTEIAHIRQELTLTNREVALALAKRAGSLEILAAVADDLIAEASRLRRLSTGKTA